MIESYSRLSAGDSAAVASLCSECERQDQAGTCVQTDHGLNADQAAPSWFLEREGGALVGLASVFAPMRGEAEISVCVRPGCRRRRLGTRLLEAAAAEWVSRGTTTLLVPCERASASGNAFAATLRGSLHHSEYSLVLDRLVPPSARGRLGLRRADGADRDALAALCADAFGDERGDAGDFVDRSLAADGRDAYVGLLGGRIVSVCFVSREDEGICVNSVAVLSAEQGKGYASEFLHGVISRRLEAGDSPVAIEVDSGNERAAGVYRRLGFVDTRSVDYWAVPAR